jgi:hypothetical protein
MTLLRRNEFYQEDSGWTDRHSGCQQFATVFFDRKEDDDTARITVVAGNGVITVKDGHNLYNPSSRRHSVCTYITDECDDTYIQKFCVIQHKGGTIFEIHSVSKEEMEYLFGRAKGKVTNWYRLIGGGHGSGLDT